MEICKNKSSNKYFIYIENTGNREALLITPEARVISLKIDLFDDVEEQEEDYLLNNKLLTEPQVKRYREYKSSRTDESFEWFEELSAYEQQIYIEKLKKIIDEK
jgi:hypothetical protein